MLKTFIPDNELEPIVLSKGKNWTTNGEVKLFVNSVCDTDDEGNAKTLLIDVYEYTLDTLFKPLIKAIALAAEMESAFGHIEEALVNNNIAITTRKRMLSFETSADNVSICVQGESEDAPFVFMTWNEYQKHFNDRMAQSETILRTKRGVCGYCGKSNIPLMDLDCDIVLTSHYTDNTCCKGSYEPPVSLVDNNISLS
jgi:hypothetical protein